MLLGAGAQKMRGLTQMASTLWVFLHLYHPRALLLCRVLPNLNLSPSIPQDSRSPTPPSPPSTVPSTVATPQQVAQPVGAAVSVLSAVNTIRNKRQSNPHSLKQLCSLQRHPISHRQYLVNRQQPIIHVHGITTRHFQGKPQEDLQRPGLHFNPLR